MNYAVIFLLLTLPLLGNSQQVLEGGIFLGASNYQGDLSPNEIDFVETHAAYGIFMNYRIHNVFLVKTSIIRSHLSGDDSNNDLLRRRSFRFEADLTETAIRLEYYPFGLRRGTRFGAPQRNFTPYLFAGVGYSLADAFVQTDLPVEQLKSPFPEENDTATFVTTPFGGGIRTGVLAPFIISGELGWRPVYSDYLDGVSINGNPTYNDWYIVGGLSVSYLFGEQESCKF